MNTPVSDVHARAGTHHGDAVRDMFDGIAPTYDRLNRILSMGVDRRWRKRAVELLGVGSSDRVLDLCAGTMDLAADVQKLRPARIVAADFAADMLEAGKHKVPGAERVVADAMSMPFDDAEFSRVVCGFGMRNLSDTHKGAREVLRVLAPKGVFVTLEFFRPTRIDTRLFHAAYARYVLPTVGSLVSGRGEAYRYLRDSMNGFFTRSEYEDILRDSGFVNVTGHDLLFGIAAIVRAERAA